MSNLSRDDKIAMLHEDLLDAMRTGDRSKHNRARSEFYNLIASESRAKGDELTILLLAAIEEANKNEIRTKCRVRRRC